MRRPEPFDRVSLAGSVVVHVVILVLAVWSSASARIPLEFVAYEIELVSMPEERAPEDQPAAEELVVERPDPAPPEPEPEDPVPVVEEETPPPPRPEERRPPPPPEPAEETRESGESINVRMEGLRRDYPEYYNNIIVQIQRCFRPPSQGSWETTVYFVITRDGTVRDMDFVQRSGNAAFDIAAMGAVECAGRGDRLGPLPEELPYDRLPIQFQFRPRGGIRGLFPDVIQNRDRP